MKIDLNRTEAQEKIDKFFERENFTSKEVKKIRRLAMKFKIKLGKKRKFFCKKCLSKLRGKIRISREFKSVECEKCGYKNKFKI